jgi:hypothetical protein
MQPPNEYDDERQRPMPATACVPSPTATPPSHPMPEAFMPPQGAGKRRVVGMAADHISLQLARDTMRAADIVCPDVSG